MTTKNADGRKRTVTVVLGPETVAMMRDMLVVAQERAPWAVHSLTGLTGACLDSSLRDLRAAWLDDRHAGWLNHYS
jgi:hypothetical protein